MHAHAASSPPAGPQDRGISRYLEGCSALLVCPSIFSGHFDDLLVASSTEIETASKEFIQWFSDGWDELVFLSQKENACGSDYRKVLAGCAVSRNSIVNDQQSGVHFSCENNRFAFALVQSMLRELLRQSPRGRTRRRPLLDTRPVECRWCGIGSEEGRGALSRRG